MSSASVRLGANSGSGSAEETPKVRRSRAKAGASGADSTEAAEPAKEARAERRKKVESDDEGASEPVVTRTSKPKLKAGKEAAPAAASVSGINYDLSRLPNTKRDQSWLDKCPMLVLILNYLKNREDIAGIYVAAGPTGKKAVGFQGLSVYVAANSAAAPLQQMWSVLMCCGVAKADPNSDGVLDSIEPGSSAPSPMTPEKMIELSTRKWAPKDGKAPKVNNGWITPTGFSCAWSLLGTTYFTYVPAAEGGKAQQLVYAHEVDVAFIRKLDEEKACGNDLDLVKAFLDFDRELVGEHLNIYLDEDNNRTTPTMSLGATQIEYVLKTEDGTEASVFFGAYDSKTMADKVIRIVITMVITDGFKGEMKNIYRKIEEEKPTKFGTRHVMKHISWYAGGVWTNPMQLITGSHEDGKPIIDFAKWYQKYEELGENPDGKKIVLRAMSRMIVGFPYLSYQPVPNAAKGQNVSAKFGPMAVYVESAGRPLVGAALYAPSKVMGDGGIDPDKQLAEAAAASCATAKAKNALAAAFGDEDD